MRWMFSKILFSLLLIPMFVACGGGGKPKSHHSKTKSKAKERYAYQKEAKSGEASIDDLISIELSKRQQAILKKYRIPVDTHSLAGTAYDIPVVMNVVEREGIDVLLHGTPGDTLFDGDSRYTNYAWRMRRYGDALRWSATYRSIYLRSRWIAVKRLLLRPLIVPKLKKIRAVRSLLAQRRALPRWFGEKLRVADSSTEEEQTNYDLSPTQRLLAVGDVSNGLDSWARHEYRKRGVRVMSPYSDHNLASFVAGLDPLLLSYGNEYRGLYRRVLEGEVPPSIAKRQSKSYFEREHEEIFRGADLASLLGYARPEALARAGWVEHDPYLHACTNALRSGQGWMQFYPYLCVEKWMREWGIQ